MTDYYAFHVYGNPARLIGTCPNCEAEIDGKHDFCINCDLYLKNHCTGFDLVELLTDVDSGLVNKDAFDIYNKPDLKINFHVLSSDSKFSGCGTYCSGQASHCSNCGSSTSFFLQAMFDDTVNKDIGTDAPNPFLRKVHLSRHG